jgi:hypothetical protein
VLAKSCKLIPVMVAGTLLYNKRYSAAEYLTAVLVAGGIVLFAVVKNSDAVLQKLAAPHAPVGYLLVTLNLALDAYTNSTQDRVRKCLQAEPEKLAADDPAAPSKQLKERFPSTTPQQFMMCMNAWGCIYYALWMFGITGASSLLRWDGWHTR